MIYYIDYLSAVTWLNRDLVMINDTIFDIDPDFEDPFKEDSEGNPREIFQRFITNFTDDEVRWMHDTFPDVLFSFCEKMNLWILCVDHWGTSWDGVWTTCELDWVKGDEAIVPHSTLNWVNDKYESKIDMVKTAKFMRCK